MNSHGTPSGESSPNPYQPPCEPHQETGGRQGHLDFTRRGVTLIPEKLAQQTQRAVRAFGLFQFGWPIAVGLVTDSVRIDLLALLIAGVGQTIGPASFKRFPWTALLCALYPIGFTLAVITEDASNIWLWLPSRGSPVLLLQLISAIWACYAIRLIVRCFLSHREYATD